MWNQIAQWIVNKLVLTILEALGKYIPHVLAEWKRKKEREIAQSEAKKKHEAVLANPEATREEMAKALEERLNAGKRQ